ncbi:MAG TPA: FmdB family zinc ribbon protein [Verrucomicrobiae bacterium]|nr:FmdB family zinc ribbon protein [Verrucomicrobiae bacterium]
MPTYEYICGKCGHEFETFQPISAKPLRICPRDLCSQKKWGRGRVKKKIGAGAGLIFKGSGFYITDYRSRKYTEAAKKEATPEKSTPKKDVATSPAKSAAAPDK